MRFYWLILVLFLVGCTQKALCPEEYSLVESVCCEDMDNNGLCDVDQVIGESLPSSNVPIDPTPQSTTPTTPLLDTGYFWDSSTISIQSYVCSNNTIGIILNNNYGSSISIEKARVGATYARSLPVLLAVGKSKRIMFQNPTLVLGRPIDESLFVQFRDFVKKSTVSVGPSKIEGVC